MAIMIQQCSITQFIGGILITVTGCYDTIQPNIFDGQKFPQPSYPLYRVYVHVCHKKNSPIKVSHLRVEDEKRQKGFQGENTVYSII